MSEDEAPRKRYVMQDYDVPAWRHEVWYDGVCLGLAIGAVVSIIIVWVLS